MKKIIKTFGSLVMALSLVTSTIAFASGEIKVTLNDIPVKFDVAPQMINDRTMVPLRAIFEALGATVEWDNNTQTVLAFRNDTTVVATIGVKTMYVNDEEKTMDVSPMLIDGRTLVPVRFVAEAFECDVDWDGNTQTVIIKQVNDEFYWDSADQGED